MKVTVTAEVFRKLHPQFQVGLILITDLQPCRQLKEAKELLDETTQLTRLLFHKTTTKNHHLISPWTAAQREFGRAAKHYHTSVERLLKRVLRKKSVATKDTVTTLVNYLALRNIVPIGVDDFDTLEGQLTFAIAKGGEKATRTTRVKKGAFYYHDDVGVLGTKLDHWKAKDSSVLPETTSVLIHIDALPPVTKKQLTALVKETGTLIQSFCGGKVKSVILDKKKRSAFI